MSGLLSEKDYKKYLEKLKKNESKIKHIEDIIFRINENGEKVIIENSSTMYLISKLKPLYEISRCLKEKLNLCDTDEEEYLSDMEQEEPEK
jgi:hypothetical protein